MVFPFPLNYLQVGSLATLATMVAKLSFACAALAIEATVESLTEPSGQISPITLWVRNLKTSPAWPTDFPSEFKPVPEIAVLAPQPIVYLHRTNRHGYKAGALDKGLEVAKGEFVAIFDADFVPPRQWVMPVIQIHAHAIVPPAGAIPAMADRRT